MKMFVSVVLVMVAMFFVAGNASAALLPVTNGDFETAPYGAWVDAPTGWNWWQGGSVITLAKASPDGGANALLIGGSIVFGQVTGNVIESGKTYTLSSDIQGESAGIYWTDLYFVLAAYDASQEHNIQLGTAHVRASDFTSETEWKTYSTPSYTADGTYAGMPISLYIQAVGAYAWIDGVRLEAVPEPCTLAMLIGGVLFAVRRRKMAA